MTLPPEVERRAAEFVAFLLTLPSDEARNDVLVRIAEDVCRHCGCVLGGRVCYCTRDD